MRKIEIRPRRKHYLDFELSLDDYTKLKSHLSKNMQTLSEWVVERLQDDDTCSAEGYDILGFRLTKEECEKLRKFLIEEQLTALEWFKTLIAQM